MVTVIEWHLSVRGAPLDALSRVVAREPYWFLPDGLAGPWATYWYATEREALDDAALVALAGWETHVTSYERGNGE